MALRDQPYIPLYVQDFLTDEKLIECSAATTGVYIKLMCVMHKSEYYGTILLKQKYKQTDKQNKNFALQIAKSVGYDVTVVSDAIAELLEEKVLRLDGDFLVQDRMVYDADISEKRSKAGKTGGDKSKSKQSKGKIFAQAKSKANSENEYEIENDTEIELDIVFTEKKSELILALVDAFGFQEQKFHQSRSMVMAFVNSQLKTVDDIAHFAEQYKNYDDYKKLSGEQRHNSTGYFGTQAMQFQNSAWNSENWGLKLQQYKSNNKNQSKFEKLQDAFNAPNPYRTNGE